MVGVWFQYAREDRGGNTYYPPLSCLPQVAEIKTPRPVDVAEGGFAVK